MLTQANSNSEFSLMAKRRHKKSPVSQTTSEPTLPGAAPLRTEKRIEREIQKGPGTIQTTRVPASTLPGDTRTPPALFSSKITKPDTVSAVFRPGKID